MKITDFGARGDGVTNDAAAIQRAIDARHAAGGGRVIVPAGGVFACGPFALKSGVELHVEHGATVAAIPDRALYPQETLPELGGDGRLWIHAIGEHEIAITGGGIIDGRGVKFMSEETPEIFRTKPDRPFMLHLEGCRHVTLRDVTFRDAPFWTVHLVGCEDVSIGGLRLDNNVKIPNTDGIDINRCRNVRIVGCSIVGGDDAICIKSEQGAAHHGDCQDIVVTGCTLRSTSCAIKIGSGTAGLIRRVVFSDCSVFASHRALGIQLRDEGVVEDILFTNMTLETRYEADGWWGDATPIYVTTLRRQAHTRTGAVRRVRFSNIVARGENGALVYAEAPGQISDVSFDNVDLQIENTARRSAGRYDLRPCANKPGVLEGPTDGFHLVNSVDTTIRNCRARWPQTPLAFHRHAVYARTCRGLRIDGSPGTAAFADRIEAIVQEAS